MNIATPHLFDTDGLFVIKHAMTPEQVATCNLALDRRESDAADRETASGELGDTGLDGAAAGPFGPGRAGTSTNSTTHDTHTNPLLWGDVFQELLDLPAVAAVLEDLVGMAPDDDIVSTAGPATEGLPSYRLDHINVHTHVQTGFQGGYLHGGSHFGHAGGSQFYRYVPTPRDPRRDK